MIKFKNHAVWRQVCQSRLQRVLHKLRTGASFFKFHYLHLSLRSPGSYLHIPPCLLVTSVLPFNFLTITCFKRQFLRNPQKFPFLLDPLYYISQYRMLHNNSKRLFLISDCLILGYGTIHLIHGYSPGYVILKDRLYTNSRHISYFLFK